MELTKSGITINVSHPLDIKHYLKLGYVRVNQPPAPQKEEETEEKPRRGRKSSTSEE